MTVLIMLLYQGRSAYSSFRLKKLRTHLQQVEPRITKVTANYIYLIEADDLSALESKKLINIVDKAADSWQEPGSQSIAFVTPRFGTISPWSSKATDIMKVCGLHKIRRIERGIVYLFDTKDHKKLTPEGLKGLFPLIHDRMTETVSFAKNSLDQLFEHLPSPPNETIHLTFENLVATNQSFGLALSEQEMQFLYEKYQALKRDPSITELVMFAQINSEHCRHKIFNGDWTIDGNSQDHSLFAMIRNTYAHTKTGVVSAYKDNGAIIEGHFTPYFFPDPKTNQYRYHEETTDIVIKVETHNHPTAIAPFEGAATGAGGEIRDEGATGIGAKPKAGLAGFSVSNLHIPNLPQPWEHTLGYPNHIASALDIMLQGPIGAAAFNNEFGRPNICGYFRSFEMKDQSTSSAINVRGYHKPIMIAGGLGQIRTTATVKETLPSGAKLIVLGGPAMLIGLGGGAASSLSAGDSMAELDFASVQRSNPEMQRRAQEVINKCWSMGKDNPIISIHDVGAGGLSNAATELVHDSNKGGTFDLRAIPTAESRLSAMEIWCNEAQERYVLGIHEKDLALFTAIADRERCPFAVFGEVTSAQKLVLYDQQYQEHPVDLPLSVLFGDASKMQLEVQTATSSPRQILEIKLPLNELITRVLQHPTVADKSFLINIGDRSVGGLVARDQMVGPWQVPVADVGVTASGYQGYTGEAIAMGERAPVALLDANAAARMTVAEAITNAMAADIRKLSDIKLSANWMAAVGHSAEKQNLFEAVKTVGMELCPALGICIPVGKDSLSMQMKWSDEAAQYNVAAPLSLVITAFAPVTDIRRTVTPLLEKTTETELLLIDLGHGQNRTGGSILAQVANQLGASPPDLDDPILLIKLFEAFQALKEQGLVLAYHDRSDGGLITTICEMSFASHVGITLNLAQLGTDVPAILFNEELGAVIQYPTAEKERVLKIISDHGLLSCTHLIGCLNDSDQIEIFCDDDLIFDASRVQLQRLWSQTSYHLQVLRDNPICAQAEYDQILDFNDPGLHDSLTFQLQNPPHINTHRPRIAILREQGVNGHLEMAAAFDRAGFEAIDVHMTDILNGLIDLQQFQGLAACGGFSYGDVLGAGSGWANSILFNAKAREQFSEFFNNQYKFVLGVCNGCQMLSQLKELIPGAHHWPTFQRNISEQFEARLSLVKIVASPSIFFNQMAESVLPIVVSHGEGKVEFEFETDAKAVIEKELIALQYVNNYGQVTEQYPANPNGSMQGITALTNEDGRFTIMMPHAERVFRAAQFSWRPKHWHSENSPWLQMFLNAYNWVK